MTEFLKTCSKKYLPFDSSSHWKLLENWIKLISLPNSFSLHFAIAHGKQFNRLPYSTSKLFEFGTFIKAWLKGMCEIVEKMSFLFKQSEKNFRLFLSWLESTKYLRENKSNVIRLRANRHKSINFFDNSVVVFNPGLNGLFQLSKNGISTRFTRVIVNRVSIEQVTSKNLCHSVRNFTYFSAYFHPVGSKRNFLSSSQKISTNFLWWRSWLADFCSVICYMTWLTKSGLMTFVFVVR